MDKRPFDNDRFILEKQYIKISANLRMLRQKLKKANSKRLRRMQKRQQERDKKRQIKLTRTELNKQEFNTYLNQQATHKQVYPKPVTQTEVLVAKSYTDLCICFDSLKKLWCKDMICDYRMRRICILNSKNVYCQTRVIWAKSRSENDLNFMLQKKKTYEELSSINNDHDAVYKLRELQVNFHPGDFKIIMIDIFCSFRNKAPEEEYKCFINFINIYDKSFFFLGHDRKTKPAIMLQYLLYVSLYELCNKIVNSEDITKFSIVEISIIRETYNLLTQILDEMYDTVKDADINDLIMAVG